MGKKSEREWSILIRMMIKEILKQGQERKKNE